MSYIFLLTHLEIIEMTALYKYSLPIQLLFMFTRKLEKHFAIKLFILSYKRRNFRQILLLKRNSRINSVYG